VKNSFDNHYFAGRRLLVIFHRSVSYSRQSQFRIPAGSRRNHDGSIGLRHIELKSLKWIEGRLQESVSIVAGRKTGNAHIKSLIALAGHGKRKGQHRPLRKPPRLEISKGNRI
jgi:hypothetical protein